MPCWSESTIKYSGKIFCLAEHESTIVLFANRLLLQDMSGLRKAKNYDWKDSNLALFGSDIEKNVRICLTILMILRI